MENFLSEYGTLFLWLGGFSLFFFFGTLAAVPLILGRLPEDFFLLPRKIWKNRAFFDPLLFILWFILKNILGTIFLLLGVLMLFTPGQGVLTLILGLIFLSFPGKKQLFKRLLANPRVRRVLNWIRRKTGKQPFLFDRTGV